MAPARIFDQDDVVLCFDQSMPGLKFVPDLAQGPLVWQGKQIRQPDYVVYLEKQDIVELEKAVEDFQSNDTFPVLP